MTRRLAAVIACVLLLPTTGFALLICTKGNQPISAENFKRWPGLADVVNDLSRVSHCWCNGEDQMWYRGDTAALNRFLQEFAEIEADEREVILLPGSVRLYYPPAKPGAEATDDAPDWYLRVTQGAVRAVMLSDGRDLIASMDPTLTVYVTERIDMSQLQVPGGIQLIRAADRRERCAKGILSDNERMRADAQRELNRLDAVIPTDRAADDIRVLSAKIDEFVRQRQAAPGNE